MTDKIQSGDVAQPTPRCEVCDWPLADSREKGCVPGDCSYRPDDPAEQRRISQRRAQLREQRQANRKERSGVDVEEALTLDDLPQCSAGSEALSRQNIAKAIAYDLEEGPAHGARVATSPYLDNYHVNGHVNLLALADAVIAQVGSEPQAPAKTPAPRPTRWPAKGDRMKFLGVNGYPFELEAAKKIFTVGNDYEVHACDVHSWSHNVQFVGVKGHFNGVMFELLPSPLTRPESK